MSPASAAAGAAAARPDHAAARPDHAAARPDQAAARRLVAGFDLRAPSAAFLDDPYPSYAALRELAPVCRMPDGAVLLTRHADVQAVCRDAAGFSSHPAQLFERRFGAGSPLHQHHARSLVFTDPPRHGRVRRLVAGALTQREIAALVPGLVLRVGQLLDHLASLPAPDLIADYAAAIPVEVIGGLIGVPADQRGPLRDWAGAVLGALEPDRSRPQLDQGQRAVDAMLAYLRERVADHRRRPGEPRHGLLDRLLGESDDAGPLADCEAPLAAGELLHQLAFLLNAGHLTTTHLIGTSLALIAQRDELRAALRADLRADGPLIHGAVEEFLRYDSPTQFVERVATAPTTLGGRPVAAGTLVVLGIGAANRDPAQFADPDRFDPARAPNRHLAFGFGIHRCAGLSLARLEVQLAIEALLRRHPRFVLAGPPVRGGGVRFRGYAALPVRLEG